MQTKKSVFEISPLLKKKLKLMLNKIVLLSNNQHHIKVSLKYHGLFFLIKKILTDEEKANYLKFTIIVFPILF